MIDSQMAPQSILIGQIMNLNADTFLFAVWGCHGDESEIIFQDIYFSDLSGNRDVFWMPFHEKLLTATLSPSIKLRRVTRLAPFVLRT